MHVQRTGVLSRDDVLWQIVKIFLTNAKKVMKPIESCFTCVNKRLLFEGRT